MRVLFTGSFTSFRSVVMTRLENCTKVNPGSHFSFEHHSTPALPRAPFWRVRS